MVLTARRYDFALLSNWPGIRADEKLKSRDAPGIEPGTSRLRVKDPTTELRSPQQNTRLDFVLISVGRSGLEIVRNPLNKCSYEHEKAT